MDTGTLHIVALINNVVAACISLVANIAVGIAMGLQWRSSKAHRYHLYSTIYIAIISVAYSINQVLASPMIHIHEHELVFVNNGIVQSDIFGEIVLAVFAFFVIYTVIFSSSQFIIKYMLVSRSYNQNPQCKIISINLFILLLAITWTALLACSLQEDHNDVFDEDGALGRPSLDSKIKGNILLIMVFSSLITLLLASSLVMIFCSRRITKELQKLQSNKSRILQTRIYHILMVEAILPFVLMHIPLAVCCILPVIDLHIDELLHNLPLLFAWYPAVSPLIVLWNLKKKDVGTKKKPSKIIPTIHIRSVTDLRGDS